MAGLNNTQTNTPYANMLSNYRHPQQNDTANTPTIGVFGKPTQPNALPYGSGWKPFNSNNYTYKPHPNRWGNEGGQYLDENGYVALQTMGGNNNNSNTLMNNFQGAYSNGLREQFDPNGAGGDQPTPNMPAWWDSNFWDNPNMKHYNTHTMEERTSPYSQNSASTPIADMLKRLFANDNYNSKEGI